MSETSVRGAASPVYELMIAVLAQNWWAIGIRGVLGILFGLIALFLPGATMLSLVLVFSAYAFVDGVVGIVSAVRAARQHERWGFLVLEGLVNIGCRRRRRALARNYRGCFRVSGRLLGDLHGHIGVGGRLLGCNSSTAAAG